MTKFELMSLIFAKQHQHTPRMFVGSGISAFGYLYAVAREDGSGDKFILTIHTTDGKTVQLFVKTID